MSPEPRIYVVVPGGVGSVGGMCRMARYYMREWQERGRRPALRLVDSYGPGSNWLKPAYFLGALGRLALDGLRGRVALVHLHMAERGSVLRKGLLLYLAKAMGLPAVVHLHAAEFVEFCEGLPLFLRRRTVAMLQAADLVIVLGTAWRRYLVERLGLPEDKVVILRNAVPGPASLAPRPEGGPCRILFLGVVGRRKGVDELLAALAAPALEGLAWQATIAGNGEVERYRARAEALGLGDRVRFAGWVDEAGTRALLAEADLFTLPSRNEGLPMAIIEAMAYGLPVVATPVGAITDAVREGETGLLVPPGDAPALAQALARLVGDPGLRRQLGAAGRAAYLAELEIGAFNDRLERLLRRVEGAKGPHEAGPSV